MPERPKKCYGPKPDQHAKGCRPGRPLCRWMRKVRPQRRPCNCGAYHYPHRKGSGRCGNPDAMNDFIYGTQEERDWYEQIHGEEEE